MESFLDSSSRFLYIPKMPRSDERRPSQSDSARSQAAVRDLTPPLALLLITQGSLIALDPKHGPTVWTVIWSLSPIVAMLWLAASQVRILRRSDEFQRVVQLQALAVGFGVTILLAAAGGLLDAARIGSTRQSLQIIFIGCVIAWTMALAIKTSRTR